LELFSLKEETAFCRAVFSFLAGARVNQIGEVERARQSSRSLRIFFAFFAVKSFTKKRREAKTRLELLKRHH